jgi:hypothetical protein
MSGDAWENLCVRGDESLTSLPGGSQAGKQEEIPAEVPQGVVEKHGKIR